MAKSALAAWLDQRQKPLSYLMHETRCSWSTMCRARDGKNVRLATARKISKATGGEVPVASLTNEASAEDDDPRAVA